MLWLTDKLHDQENQELADFGEYLTLFLGICLTIISLVNPTLRTANFLLSTITLATFIQRHSHKLSIVNAVTTNQPDIFNWIKPNTPSPNNAVRKLNPKPIIIPAYIWFLK